MVGMRGALRPGGSSFLMAAAQHMTVGKRSEAGSRQEFLQSLQSSWEGNLQGDKNAAIGTGAPKRCGLRWAEEHPQA